MTTIEQIIQTELNPFDTVTFRTGNFWQDGENTNLTVESIHLKELNQIISLLDQIIANHQSRTAIICGERGGGKSYLLARLKQLLNQKACFVYIGPWGDTKYLWRHILRHTVDSLMQVPVDQSDSQLILWLKELNPFRNLEQMDKLSNQRGAFILHLRSIYSVNIYQAKEFFTILYHLTQPETRYLACDWLRGENLDQEDLTILGVPNSVNTEAAAQQILVNLSRISKNTLPIVLCFDQIDKVAQYSDGDKELQALFSLNTYIHNEKLPNFLVLISLITASWKNNKPLIIEADLDRIDEEIILKDINLQQAEAIWAKRLLPIHSQLESPPTSSIAPLSKQALEIHFPGGKTNPRDTLKLGRKLFEEIKLNHSQPAIEPAIELEIEPAIELEIKPETQPETQPEAITLSSIESVEVNISETVDSTIDKPSQQETLMASFGLLWTQELSNIKEQFPQSHDFASLDLIQMLKEALIAIGIDNINAKFLPSKSYQDYSLSFVSPQNNQTIGVVWTEVPNLTDFYYTMFSCQKAIKDNLCRKIYLLRNEQLGTPKHKSYQLYQELMENPMYQHLQPDSQSIYYLATYYHLVNICWAEELVLGDQTIDIAELQTLMKRAKVLQQCQLFQDLLNKESDAEKNNQLAKFLLNLLTNQRYTGIGTLLEATKKQFTDYELSYIEATLDELAENNQIKILRRRGGKTNYLVSLYSESK